MKYPVRPLALDGMYTAVVFEAVVGTAPEGVVGEAVEAVARAVAEAVARVVARAVVKAVVRVVARAVVKAVVPVVAPAVVKVVARIVFELVGIENHIEAVGATVAVALIGTIAVLLPVAGQNLSSITTRIKMVMSCFNSAIFLLHSNATLIPYFTAILI